KSKDQRSMQIDHIIPARIYIRYKLFRQRNQVAGDDHDSRTQGQRELRNAYNDTANLLLCCAKCNSGEQQTMPNDQGLRDAKGRVTGSNLENRLEALREVARRINSFGTESAINVKAFLLNGADWSTTTVVTRHGTSPYTQGGATQMLKKQLSNINNLVIEE